MDKYSKQTRANSPEVTQNQKGSDSSLSDSSNMSNVPKLSFEEIVKIIESKIQFGLASMSVYNMYCMWRNAKNLEGQFQTSGDDIARETLKHLEKKLREAFDDDSARAEQAAKTPGDVMLDARMRAVRLIRIENDVRITATLSLLDQVYVSGNSNITAVAISELHAVCDAAEKNRMERKIQNAKEAAALEALLDEDRKKEREDKNEIVRLAQQKPPRPPPPPGPQSPGRRAIPTSARSPRWPRPPGPRPARPPPAPTSPAAQRGSAPRTCPAR